MFSNLESTADKNNSTGPNCESDRERKAQVEHALISMAESADHSVVPLRTALSQVLRSLDVLADTVLQDLAPIKRRKCEHLITELVHQRDVIRALLCTGVKSAKNFEWLYQILFYFDAGVSDPLARLSIHLADASFAYDSQ